MATTPTASAWCATSLPTTAGRCVGSVFCSSAPVGAVRGVLSPLLAQQPRALTIANRTVAKAEQLRALFADDDAIASSGFAALAGQQFDVIINGTSLGLQGKVAPIPDAILRQGALAYDMMYGKGAQPFCQWAKAQGAAVALDGLGMLVEQAAESFLLWRGVRPKTATVIAQLRDAIAA